MATPYKFVSTKRFGVFDATPVEQQAKISVPTDEGDVIDVEARAALAEIVAVLEAYGLTASE